MAEQNCTFCKIIHDENRKMDLLYEDDEMAVFLDYKPASSHHYLVCPKQHIHGPKVLTKNDLGLVERMMSIGMNVLQQRDGNMNDVRTGFHWPPFVAVNHLHLHVISPVSQMTWISRGIFKEDSYWFVSVKWLMDRLAGMPDPEGC